MKTRAWSLTGLATTLLAASLFAPTAQAHTMHALATAPEWQQRPMEQAQPNPQDKVDFSLVQTECVPSAIVQWGNQGPWSQCRIGRTGFIATIGLQDFYYTNYCLVAKGDACAKQAQVVFRNRAYRPEAFVDMTRIDPPGTHYEQPLLVGSDVESVLATAARLPGKQSLQRRFFRYSQDRWVPIDGQGWLQQLRAALPAGLAVRIAARDALPDPETMELRLPLYRNGDAACCAKGGQVKVRLAIADGQLTLAEHQISGTAK